MDWKRTVAATLTGVGLLLAGAGAKAASSSQRILDGFVEGNGERQSDYEVSLYASYPDRNPFLLGSTTTDATGYFAISYELPFKGKYQSSLVTYLLAEKDGSLLAVALAGASAKDSVTLNERTTVATGVAFAQFIDERDIRGNKYGVVNAASMASNLADPRTGLLAFVLANSPNADETSTRATFNSMANLVATCVAEASNCGMLLDAATSPGGSTPATVLQALANMTRFPQQGLADLFTLSLQNSTYTPALGPSGQPASWLLFIKFTGGFYQAYDSNNLMSGPGNVAIDERGFVWINDNYVPNAQDAIACAGLRLMKFAPNGRRVPGSPYFGGGLSGAGFGIALDPRGRVWVGNFGFEAPDCATQPPDPTRKIPATHDSVSLFESNGAPISPDAGFTAGDISWPQATVSDPRGNIWIANCGNDTVTFIPKGNPKKARNYPLPSATTTDEPLLKPFAIAIGRDGRAWVTGNKAGYVSDDDPVGAVYRVSPNGEVQTIDSARKLSWPMGISTDSQGNAWVSSSDTVNVPCVDPFDPMAGGEPAVLFYPRDGGTPSRHIGGGLSIPWGNAVDGDDTLWVFNFGHTPLDEIGMGELFPDTGISRFCGTGPCPGDKVLGEPISEVDGYTSDALDRITGGGIDPSGNLWLVNNWTRLGPELYDTNPGGNSFVIVPGAAAPIQTPLIGPPVPFD